VMYRPLRTHPLDACAPPEVPGVPADGRQSGVQAGGEAVAAP